MPSQIKNVFSKYRTIDTGIQHGTVTVIVNDMQIECTTYRIDGEYTDNRRPNNVTFTDNIEDDLARRDFTINAIAFNPSRGFVDPFGGLNDIEKRVIRTVGNPNDRFNEDGLRILRALRFAAQLGFDIEENTSKAIHDCKHMLDNVSKERIQSELCKILMSEQCGYILFVLYDDVFKTFLPDTRINFGKRLTMSNVASVSEDGDDIVSRLALLFDGDDSKVVYNSLKELKFSNEIVSYVTQLVSCCNEPLPLNKHEIKMLMGKLNAEQMKKFIFINKYKAKRMGEESSEFADVLRMRNLFNEIIDNNECYSLKQLKINGDDLIATGIPQGKMVGSILEALLNAVIEDRIENDREQLLQVAINAMDNVNKQGYMS